MKLKEKKCAFVIHTHTHIFKALATGKLSGTFGFESRHLKKNNEHE